jgi:hypothetical protein
VEREYDQLLSKLSDISMLNYEYDTDNFDNDSNSNPVAAKG